jgi:hypothetical protein
MTLVKQIEANQRNALKSTGPVTAEGKLLSRCNAVRHGLTAETVIGSFEDADDYQAFELSVTSGYDAHSAAERELVLRLASILWRLRRATAIETALLEAFSSVEPARDEHQVLTPFMQRLFKDTRPSRPAPAPQNDLLTGFMRATELTSDAFDRLNRYEYLLWRQARQLISTLESLRRCPNLRRSQLFINRRQSRLLPEHNAGIKWPDTAE